MNVVLCFILFYFTLFVFTKSFIVVFKFLSDSSNIWVVPEPGSDDHLDSRFCSPLFFFFFWFVIFD